MDLPPEHLENGITGLVLTSAGAERLAEQCFASLGFCDKILAVDSGSSQQAKDIIKKYGVTLVNRPWEGFASQFNFAKGIITTRWFFILDQDEICQPKLAKQIRTAIENAENNIENPNTPVAFSIGRKSWYFDRFMTSSGWYPDHILRVFRTDKVEFYQDAHIHYRALGKTAHLGGQDAEIIHYPYTGFDHQMAKLNVYAQQGADSMKARGAKASIAKAIGHGLWRFCRIYFMKKGFLDGRAGFLAAAHGAIYAFLKYARVLEASWGKPFDHK